VCYLSSTFFNFFYFFMGEGLPLGQAFLFPLLAEVVAPAPLTLDSVEFSVRAFLKSHATLEVVATLGIHNLTRDDVVSDVSVFQHF
jgi:hypothetical protein